MNTSAWTVANIGKGLKTLSGVVLLTLPYLDEKVYIEKFDYLFDVSDFWVSILTMEEVVAFAGTLIVFGLGMKVVNFIKSIAEKSPKKK